MHDKLKAYIRREFSGNGEDGVVATVFVICAIVLIMAVVILACIVPAFTGKMDQKALLAKVDMELGLPSSMILDSQTSTATGGYEDSSLAVANRITKVLRDNGYEEAITIWFFEPRQDAVVNVVSGVPTNKIDYNDRLWAWGVQLDNSFKNIMPNLFEGGDLEVSSITSGVANPYAMGKVFRQAGMTSVTAGNKYLNVKYVCPKGTTKVTKSMRTDLKTNFKALPQVVQDEFIAAYKNLRAKGVN